MRTPAIAVQYVVAPAGGEVHLQAETTVAEHGIAEYDAAGIRSNPDAVVVVDGVVAGVNPESIRRLPCGQPKDALHSKALK